MDIIETLRKIRQQKKLSQEDIAKLLNMSRSNYSEIEQKRVNLKVEDFLKICNFLNIPLNTFSDTTKINITIDKSEIKIFQKIINNINEQINVNNNSIIGDNNNINSNNITANDNNKISSSNKNNIKK